MHYVSTESNWNSQVYVEPHVPETSHLLLCAGLKSGLEPGVAPAVPSAPRTAAPPGAAEGPGGGDPRGGFRGGFRGGSRCVNLAGSPGVPHSPGGCRFVTARSTPSWG